MRPARMSRALRTIPFLMVVCFVSFTAQTTSNRGTGKTTVQMQTADTFLEMGWDFVDETANGTENIWWIDEGQDYPHLWWEPIDTSAN